MISKIFNCLFFASVYSLVVCGQTNPQSIYKGKLFSVFSDRVEQGKYTAKALSPFELESNYQSPANESYSRVIVFKFSINGKDDELPMGVNHELAVYPTNGDFEAPVIVFGERLTTTTSSKDFLEPNTKVHFKLDMRPVLRSFSEKGYYQDIKGEKIAKEDFKGVFIAGGSDPLSWDFENLVKKDMELKDDDGDSIYTVTKVFNAYNPYRFTAQSWKKSKDISSFAQLKSPFPLIDAVYNLTLEELVQNIEPDGTFRTGKEWDGVWTRDISYSVVLGVGAAYSQISLNSLRRKVKRNRIIQDTGSGGSWPVSTDRTIWALAAWELYCVTGDKEWLLEAYTVISNTLEDDLKNIFSPQGLAKGESSFLDWRKQEYPLWMNNVDIANSENLGTNVVHFQAYNVAARMAALLGKKEAKAKYEKVAASISRAVNSYLWVPNKYYAQFRYGRHAMSLSKNPEMLGEALAVLHDLAPKERQVAILKNTPVTPFGTTCFYPQIPGIPPYHNNGIWLFVQGFWNMAAAKMQNGAALEHGLASLYREIALFLTNKENSVAQNGDFKTELNSDRQLWSIGASLGTIYKIFFGMDFQPSGIRFKPVVPKSYQGEWVLEKFNYRNAVLTVKMKGFGSKIKSFKLDGKLTKAPFFSANLKGKHSIEIELANNNFSTGTSFNLVENKFAPLTPVVKRSFETLTWPKEESAVSFNIFKNGLKISSTTDSLYELKPDENAAEYAVQAVSAEDLFSFLSEPIAVIPENKLIKVEAEMFAEAVKRKLSGFSGQGAIEINQQEKEIEFTAEVPVTGEYWVDFRYSNGSGPINTDNKCALRALFVNSKNQGSMVFPQRGNDEWSNWGFTNARIVKLNKGKNVFSLKFLPENENMNVDVNTALIDFLRIIKK